MDVSGENQIDVDHDLFKQRLTLSGEKIEDEPEKEGNILLVLYQLDVMFSG